MGGSKNSSPFPEKRPDDLARYQQLVTQQSNPADWNGYAQDLGSIFRKVLENNQYKQEFASLPVEPVPEITAKELTKEEFKERVERKLDLAESKITDPVEIINHGRWRQVMEEVFNDKEPKKDD